MNTYEKNKNTNCYCFSYLKVSVPIRRKKSDDFKKQVKKHSNIHKTKAEKDLVLHRYPIS